MQHRACPNKGTLPDHFLRTTVDSQFSWVQSTDLLPRLAKNAQFLTSMRFNLAQVVYFIVEFWAPKTVLKGVGQLTKTANGSTSTRAWMPSWRYSVDSQGSTSERSRTLAPSSDSKLLLGLYTYRVACSLLIWICFVVFCPEEAVKGTNLLRLRHIKRTKQ